MSYRFKLEALRRYRRFQEDNLQRELSDLQRRRDQESDRLKRALEQRRRTEDDFAASQADPDFASQINLYRSYLDSLAKQISVAQRALTDAEMACADKLAELLEAVKTRKILDKLKEKSLEEHRLYMDREEQKFINEMAVNRFNLNRR